MTAPQWLDDTVRVFGRQLRLQRLTLGANGVAGVAFADGAALKLEYSRERLAVMVTRPIAPSPRAAAAVLAAAHPRARGEFLIRSGLFAAAGKAFFTVVLAEREVTADRLAKAFQELWAAAAAATGAAI